MRYIDDFSWIREAPSLLDKLDAAQLADIVDGLARRLDELPKALGGAVAPHWDEIVSRRYDWDRRAREAAALRKLAFLMFVGFSIFRLLVLVPLGDPLAGSGPGQAQSSSMSGRDPGRGGVGFEAGGGPSSHLFCVSCLLYKFAIIV